MYSIYNYNYDISKWNFIRYDASLFHRYNALAFLNIFHGNIRSVVQTLFSRKFNPRGGLIISLIISKNYMIIFGSLAKQTNDTLFVEITT